MSAVMQLSQVGSPVSLGRGASQTPLDPDRAEDLYAIWKQIFDRAQAVDTGHDETRPPVADARMPQGDRNAGDAQNALPSDDIGGRDLTHQQPALSAGAAPVQEDAAVRVISVVWANASADEPCAESRLTTAQRGANISTSTTVATQAALKSCEAAEDCSAMQPSSRMALRTAVAYSASTESVNVFVRGSAVAIVVRDAAISEQEAVHCAFETARKLTGQRASLQQLTLNGRTLYQQQSDPGTRGPQPSSVVFAC